MKRKREKRKTPQSVRRTGKRLCYAGWGLFALSMFLPVLDVPFSDTPMNGWQYGGERPETPLPFSPR